MASQHIFKDIEEALSREVRRISYHDARTVDKTILRETFDPFSGEIVEGRIEPEYYDSSADAGVVQYPHFFIKILKTKEDRFTGRVIPQYGKWCIEPVKFSPKAYEIILYGEALVNSPGDTINTTTFQIRKIQPGNLIRLQTGNNKGTYIVDTVTPSSMGDHTLTVSSTLVQNLPSFTFDAITRTVLFDDATDISTILVGDTFIDSINNSYSITSVDANNGKIIINGVSIPNLSSGSIINRSGNILLNSDLSLVKFLVLDANKPIQVSTLSGSQLGSASYIGVSPKIPIDAYYQIRIDSKTRENHIDVLNRVWEEYNPPRTALPVIVRTASSADQLLKTDVISGGSSTIDVESNENYNVGEIVYIFDDLTPTKRVDGEGFERPFESIVLSKTGDTTLVLKDTVPDTFLVSNCTKVVSNPEFQLLMMHFVDHNIKDVEGAQYWVHEFIFWVQLYVDRLEQSKTTTTVTKIEEEIDNIDTNFVYSEK